MNNHIEWKSNINIRDGFDVIIGNPPYVFARDSKSKGITKENKAYFYKHYKLASYQINLYPLFIENATKSIKENGYLCLIVPNNWMTVNTNKDLREYILNMSNISIINCYEKVFESASVDSSIIIFEKSNKNKNIKLSEYLDVITLVKDTQSEFFLSQKDFLINIESLKNTNNVSTNESPYDYIMKKIESNKLLLNQVSDVKAGLQAYELNKGIPKQTEKMKSDRIYHSTSKKDDSYFKYLDGDNVSRYLITWNKEYLKYGKNLASPRSNFDLFSSKRILVRQIPSKPPYSINACFTKEILLNDRNSMNVINIKFQPEYILGLLNSKLITFWFVHKFGKFQRKIFPQFKINELEIFPIYDISSNPQLEKILSNLVNKILEKKKANENTQDLEDKIDQMVYLLYNLTQKEIDIVEGNIMNNNNG